MMARAGPLTPGWTREGVGKLLEASTPAGSEVAETGKAPRGLYVSTCPSTPGTARVRATFGNPVGGAAAVVRDFVIGPRGAWFVGSGWQIVTVEVTEVPAGIKVQAAWTTEPPPDTYPLQQIEAVAAGTFPVPAGASRVGLGAADAGWSWTTDPGSGPLVIPNPAPGNGGILTVQGTAYTATAPNVACWFLEVP